MINRIEEENHTLKVEQLIHIYNFQEVLNIPSLTFNQGKIYALVGPNGAGKTTLLLILSLLLKPTSGRIFYYGKEITDEISKKIRGRITMLFQEPVLFNSTVYENVEYGLKIRHEKLVNRKKRVEECLELVGLKNFGCRKAREISSGEAQRVAIARALAINPEVLLLDEPTACVDDVNTKILERIILTLCKNLKTTVIFSTHNHRQAFRLADEVVTLMAGKIVHFRPENIFQGRSFKLDDDSWFDTGKIKISLPFEVDTKAVFIDPKDILISLNPFSSSARNCFEGIIEGIWANGDQIKIEVYAKEHFQVLITKKSYYEMGLNIGMKVFLTFKSSAIQFF